MDTTEEQFRSGRKASSKGAEEERLTNLETSWTVVRNAHTPGPAGQQAMRDLIGRYHDAVERYIKLKIRDPNLADEILQEFWTKLLTHKLAGADQSKGRFRDYLRTVLHRLIIDHFRNRKLQPLPPGDLIDPSAPDHDYERIWREAIIRRVWSRLETYEATTAKNRYATVLHLRVAHPDASIEQLATQLSASSGTRVSPEAYRKTLQRARAKFLEQLIEELRATIHPATPEDIEAEIFDLGLATLYRRYSSSSSE
jgi:RNA polymerase sigma-70 factor (ECF subfamily)